MEKLKEKALNKFGSDDYKSSPEVLRKTMNIILNEDQKGIMPNIKAPTLMIWGDKDTAVPINRAYELNKLIKNSKLIVYENCTHYAYLEKLDEVCNEINNFIK